MPRVRREPPEGVRAARDLVQGLGLLRHGPREEVEGLGRVTIDGEKGEKKPGESTDGAKKTEGAASSDRSKDTSRKGSSGGSEKSSTPAKKEPAPS